MDLRSVSQAAGAGIVTTPHGDATATWATGAVAIDTIPDMDRD
jgi:hypothetical protein